MENWRIDNWITQTPEEFFGNTKTLAEEKESLLEVFKSLTFKEAENETELQDQLLDFYADYNIQEMLFDKFKDEVLSLFTSEDKQKYKVFFNSSDFDEMIFDSMNSGMYPEDVIEVFEVFESDILVSE